jgi:hypothetical protein
MNQLKREVERKYSQPEVPTEAEPVGEPEKEESKDPRPEDIKADLVEPEEEQPRVIIKKK